MAQKEYSDSKNVIQTISRGFVKQVKRLEMLFEEIEREVDVTNNFSNKALINSTEALETTLKSLEEVKKLSIKIIKTNDSLEELQNKIEKLGQIQNTRPISSKIEAPIPVHREEVLDQLTDTELEVLIIIEEIGEGTVPEIKEAISKTREHTARTLKKLYDKGYVDRNTSNMPYKYNIRPEIKDIILQKKEAI
jgi:hypothetical protein